MTEEESLDLHQAQSTSASPKVTLTVNESTTLVST